jgi:hypothetical protein
MDELGLGVGLTPGLKSRVSSVKALWRGCVLEGSAGFYRDRRAMTPICIDWHFGGVLDSIALFNGYINLGSFVFVALWFLFPSSLPSLPSHSTRPPALLTPTLAPHLV